MFYPPSPTFLLLLCMNNAECLALIAGEREDSLSAGGRSVKSAELKCGWWAEKKKWGQKIKPQSVFLTWTDRKQWQFSFFQLTSCCVEFYQRVWKYLFFHEMKERHVKETVQTRQDTLLFSSWLSHTRRFHSNLKLWLVMASDRLI